jgi:hypothetical protein
MGGPSFEYATTSTTSTRALFLCAVLASIVGGRGSCIAGWVDPDTPEEYLATSANYMEDTREYELVRIHVRAARACTYDDIELFASVE